MSTPRLVLDKPDVMIGSGANNEQFDEKYYTGDPAEGGVRAALDLKAAVQEYLLKLNPDFGNLPIIVRAYASEGLGYFLQKAGLFKTDSLSAFTRAFSQADDLFDHVSIGKGKDRADHKIMGKLCILDPSPRPQGASNPI